MLEVTSDYIKAIENHLRVFEANFDLNGKRYTKTKIASATYDSSIGIVMILQLVVGTSIV